MRLLDDQTDLAAEERTRRGIVDQPSDGQMTIDEALDGAEDAAKRVLRLEQRRALTGTLVLDVDPIVPADAAELDDQEIARWLLDLWEGIEYVDEGEDREKDRVWPGIVRHETEAGRVVWCAVATVNGVPRFFYDVDPEQFDPATLAATFQGEPLFREVRRAWGVLPDEPEVEVRVETEEEPPEDPFAAWKRRTRPEATMDSNTSILLQGVHVMLLERDNLAGRLFAAHQEGIDADALAELLGNTLEAGATRSIAVNIVGEGNVEYVAVSAKVDPLRFTMKRGRKTEKLDGQNALTAIRTMLELPEMREPEGEPVAVGADDEDGELPF